MRILKLLGKLLYWAVFIAAIILCGMAILKYAAQYKPFFGVIVALAVSGYLCLRKPAKQKEGEDIRLTLYNRRTLYPVPLESATQKNKGREKYARDLSYQGFLPVGLFQIYETDFGHILPKDHYVEGFVNSTEKAYAAAHYPADAEPWLEIIAPGADGGSVTGTDADWNVTVFAQRRPGHPAAAAPGGTVANVMGAMLEVRTANQVGPGEVSMAGFAEYYMREDAAHRDWVLATMREKRDTDMAVRNQLLATGVVPLEDIAGVLIVYDRLAMWQVFFLLLVSESLWPTKKELESETWKLMSPRQVFAYLAENPKKILRNRPVLLTTLDSPVAADVYRIEK